MHDDLATVTEAIKIFVRCHEAIYELDGSYGDSEGEEEKRIAQCNKLFEMADEAVGIIKQLNSFPAALRPLLDHPHLYVRLEAAAYLVQIDKVSVRKTLIPIARMKTQGASNYRLLHANSTARGLLSYMKHGTDESYFLPDLTEEDLRF